MIIDNFTNFTDDGSNVRLARGGRFALNPILRDGERGALLRQASRAELCTDGSLRSSRSHRAGGCLN
jgi:hypothetical protein